MSGAGRTVAIIQARRGSSRLPGKVLLEIAGQPMLAHVVRRTRQAATLDAVVVATTTDPGDDPLETFCRSHEIPFYRGHPQDVLDRYYQTALAFDATAIVRLTADCPLIDPAVIDHTVETFRAAGVDFAANRLPPPWHRTYPIGLDTEICTFAALARAWQEADRLYQREHVMPYLYEEPGRFEILLVDHEPDYGHYRWTVDTPEDLALVREIFARFAPDVDFSWKAVLALFEREPALAEINAGVRHKTHGESES
jgi:spore coat polysaccharide biosynthesis protein SpsF